MKAKLLIRGLLLCASVLSCGQPIQAADAKPAATKAAPRRPDAPKPTRADVPYGAHPRQVLDLYKAESATPTPLVFFIHSGAWMNGTKAFNASGFLNLGISVVSIQYRYISDALKEKHMPPVEWPLRDAARALQFVRSKAAEWNIDKKRIGGMGESAGACSCLWLAFHDDMADPNSADPIARESTRLFCAAVSGAQTTLDPQQMKEWTPNSRYGGHAFGFTVDYNRNFDKFLAGRDKVVPWIQEYSPYALVTSDDPPVYLYYNGGPPALGKEQKDPTHTANFGLKLQEKCRSVGVECILAYPGAKEMPYRHPGEYLADRLKAAK